jgi:trans-aconitate methyltransferase
MGITRGTRLLDVGCGAGLALQLAAKRGATVAGFDASAGLLEVARERVPEADLRQGDVETLPCPDGGFEQEAAAWGWLRRHDEREYSCVDVTSFRVMRDRRVREALAFDQGFAAAGFVELRPS